MRLCTNVSIPFSELKQRLDEIEKVRNFLSEHHENNHQACQGGHGCLLFPAGPGQDLIQDGYDNPNCRNFKNKINFHLNKKNGQRRPGAQAKRLIASDTCGLVFLERAQF